MSEDAPQLTPPDGEQQTTQAGDDATVYDTDPTHPRGNKELAEQMAHAEKPDTDYATENQQMVNRIREKEALEHADDEAKGIKVLYNGMEKYADGLQEAADVATQRGDRRAEAVRQEYLTDHPELVSGQTESNEAQEAEAAERLHEETLQAIKDLLLEIPADQRGNHLLYYYDPELKIGISANYNAGNSDNNGSQENFRAGIYTAREFKHILPYGDMGDYLRMRQPELARATYEASITWSSAGKTRMLQDEKDKFVKALSEMGVPETDELSGRFQKTLDLTGGEGLSSESGLSGFGWRISGATVDTIKTVGGEIRIGRDDWPGRNVGDVEGVATEQTGQALKELIQRGIETTVQAQAA